MGEMILASLSKIWHLVPIVMAIVLFKIFLNKKSNKDRIKKNEENEKQGLSLVSRTMKKYEDSGYTVINSALDDFGIDLLCSKDDKTLLIKCSSDTNPKSISSEDIMSFHTNAKKYIKSNDLEPKNVEFRYGILYRDVLDKSAIKILTNDSYNCKYMVL